MAADAVLIDALHRVGLGPRWLGTGQPRAGLLLAGKVVPLEAARDWSPGQMAIGLMRRRPVDQAE